MQKVSESLGMPGFAVCCLDMHNFVVRVWVEKAIFLTMKVPCIDFEGVIYYLVVLFAALLGAPVGDFSRQAIRVRNKGVGITAMIQFQQ